MFVFLLIHGILLSFASLTKDFWGDEIYSIEVATKGFYQVIEAQKYDANPFLYFLILSFWIKLIPYEGEFWIRLPSVVFSLVALILTFRIGQIIFKGGEKIGIFLCSISPFLILYLPQARPYSLTFLLSLASLYSLIKAIYFKKNFWLFFILSKIALFFTNYLAFYLVFTSSFAVCILKFRNQLRYFLISSLCVSLVIFLWVFEFLKERILMEKSAPEGLKFPSLLDSLIKIFYPFYSFSFGQTILPWEIISIVGCIAYFFILFKFFKIKKNSFIYFVLCFFIFPIFLNALITSLILPRYSFIVYPRFLGYLSFLFYLIVGKILSTMSKSTKMMILSFLTIVNFYSLSNYYLNKAEKFHNPVFVIPWQSVAKIIEKEENPKDLIIFDDSPFEFYYKGKCEIIKADYKMITAKKKIENKKPNVIWVLHSGKDKDVDFIGKDFYDYLLAKGWKLKEKRNFCPIDDLTCKIKLKFFGKSYKYKLKLQKYER